MVLAYVFGSFDLGQIGERRFLAKHSARMIVISWIVVSRQTLVW